MDAEELLVHDSRQGQVAERVHARIVHGLRVLVLALELEGKVICQVTALVVPAEKEEGIGVPNLEGPQVENTLALGSSTTLEILTSMEK